MSHSQNSDDRSAPQPDPKTSAPTTEQNQGAAHGWTDPSYSVGLGSFKYLFYVNQNDDAKKLGDFSAPNTVQPDTVPQNQTTNPLNNQAGESAKSAGEIMNDNDNNIPQSEPANVEYIETESHGRRAIVFSQNFRFKPTLLSIFWKIDKDDDQRLSKSELFTAMASGRFNDDEELIICLLWRHFDNIRRQKITSSTFFDRRGVSVDEIVGFGGWSRYLPEDTLNVGTAKTFRRPPGSIRPHGK